MMPTDNPPTFQNRGTTKHVLAKDGTANYDDVAKALDRAKVCMLGILGIARVVVIGDQRTFSQMVWNAQSDSLARERRPNRISVSGV